MTLRKLSSSSSEENIDDEDEEEEMYEVEKILDHKVDSKGRRRFLLKWKGYPNEENSWEYEENLDCPKLLTEYLEKAKLYEKENIPKSRLIERPTEITKSHINKKNEIIYTAVYKDGETKDFTSRELYKLTPQLQISYLEQLADFKDEKL